MPSNNVEKPPKYPTTDPPFRKSDKLYEIVPDDPNKGYDVRQVIYEIVDILSSQTEEVKKDITAFLEKK